MVQVGGDGLFQEVLNAVLTVRARADDGPALAAAQLRLGHIPAGSTDAVAYSINGTRSAFTAAAHIALGDRSASQQPVNILLLPPSSSTWILQIYVPPAKFCLGC